MKLIIMFLLFSYTANATTYYVSNAGSDAANGTSEGSSWETIPKVNASTFAPGDFVLFKGGDSFSGTLRPPNSGTSNSRITFGSYGTGKAIFTALQTLTGFADQGGNIWTVTASNSVASLNTVIVNGVIKGKGRYPNQVAGNTTASTLAYNSVASTQSKIVISGASNYVGADVVISPQTWVLDVCPVRSQTIDSLYIHPPLTYATTSNRYFLQNLPAFCDVAGEWAYDSTTKVLSVYSVGDPSGNVQISTIDTLISLHLKDYITFDGLSIIGANNVGICRDTTNYITIENCTINYTGGYNPLPITKGGQAGAAIRGENAAYSVTKNNSISNSLNNGIFDIHGSAYDSVYNNDIQNISVLTGMGASGNGAGIAIFIQGSHATITNNIVDSIGYNGIWFTSADTSVVKNNYVTNFCYNKADGGGIYTEDLTSPGSRIISNIVGHGLGASGGNVPNLSPAIYLDYSATAIIIDSNTVYDCYLSAIWWNWPKRCFLRDNTVMNGRGAGFRSGTGSETFFVDITRNIFYATDSTYPCYQLDYGTLFTGSTSDTNYFISPSETKKFYNRQTSLFYSQADWTALTGYEIHSLSSPAGIVSPVSGTLYINPTTSDSTIALPERMINAKGVVYDTEVTIEPFQSELLFVATDQTFPLPVSGSVKRLGTLNF